ncbi:MAG: FtsX-like permease family protein [Chitinophagales bacterium]
MKLAFQLAYKNLIGAGLRTWLNVSVLTFTFILIIFFNGMLDGWHQQAKTDSIAWEYGNGQLLHKNYDPFDPFTLQDGHGEFSAALAKTTVPILIRQASIYPEGRMLSVALKGIDINQNILALPTQSLKDSEANIPVMMGKGMAESAKLKEGDEILLRWRDKNGTFDASNITLVKIFDTDVPTVDKGQIWMGIDQLWQMTSLQNHATMLIANKKFEGNQSGDWNFKSQEELLSDITEIISMKKASSSIMYLLLLAIALLAIFDTQVLSVFRRQKEIGTYIALGMTRPQVVGIFTVEGSMYSIFATIVGCIIGIPLFIWLAKTGIALPAASTSQDMGIAISEVIYPVYGLTLILGTILLVVLSATIVSYLPAKKISRMNPVEALKGKLQ